MKRVGLIFGGRSVEHQVSVASARTVARGLREAGYQVHPLGIAPDGTFVKEEEGQAALDGLNHRLPEGGGLPARSLFPLLGADLDVLFPIIHGTWGEDGTLQGFCEIIDLPYVGPGVMTSAVAMDKVACKQILQSNDLPVVECEVVSHRQLRDDEAVVSKRLERIALPLFVKPAVGGSSVGISKVTDRSELLEAIRLALRFDERVLVERGVDGRELECAVLGYERLEASAVGEIVPGGDFYDYSDKYIDDHASLIAPADLSGGLSDRIRQLSITAFQAIGGHGMARVDFLLEGESTLHINEINTHPGFTDISMYPRLWGVSGVPLPELVHRLVEIAIERHADRRQLDQGIKAWLVELSHKTPD